MEKRRRTTKRTKYLFNRVKQNKRQEGEYTLLIYPNHKQSIPSSILAAHQQVNDRINVPSLFTGGIDPPSGNEHDKYIVVGCCDDDSKIWYGMVWNGIV